MARRRQEVALQTEIETQEEWNETVNKEGLTGKLKNIGPVISIDHSFSVIDVYQQWAGSCKSVEGNFKRIKLETGEPLLKFALVIIIIIVVSCVSSLFLLCQFSSTSKHTLRCVRVPKRVLFSPYLHVYLF